MQQIIITREPKGLFWTLDFFGERIIVLDSGYQKIIDNETCFIGCDNSSGDAFIEEFKYLEDCLNWLNNK